MPNRLDLPPELASLIEKREQEERRKNEHCSEPNVTEAPQGEERRSKPDRRTNRDHQDGEST